MTYEQAMNYIESTYQYGEVLGIDNIRELLKQLDNPQDKLSFIHISGTNGKGSTAAYISTILAESGYRVGRYISPTILGYRERIQVANQNSSEFISEEAVAKYLSKIKQVIEKMQQEGLPHPTTFEIETAMAFLEFLDEKCNLVVLEVGLGGRMDATNVIRNTVCAVITSISMDHMQFLGNKIEMIAYEKAGIIKEGCKVISYDQEETILNVIRTVCQEKNASLSVANFAKLRNVVHCLSGVSFDYVANNNMDFKDIKTNLIGENQPKNAALAIEVAVALENMGYSVDKDTIREGILKTMWKGRFEILCKSPLFLVDGAHNESAAISLRQSIQLYLSGKRLIFIMGVLADKDYDAILNNTAEFASVILTVTPKNTRGLESKRLAEHAIKYCEHVIDAKDVSNAIKLSFEMAEKKDAILAFGTLSFMEEVYQEFNSSCHSTL